MRQPHPRRSSGVGLFLCAICVVCIVCGPVEILGSADAVGGGPMGVIGSAAATAQAVITGTVAYRERVELSPLAALEVILEDVTRVDGPAEVIAERQLTGVGQAPIRFELPFDPARIVANHRYNLRIRITDGGDLRFVSAEALPVLTGGHGTTVDAVLQSVGGTQPQRPPSPRLEDTTWRLVTLGGKPVEATRGPREPHVVLRSTSVAGATGCNTFRGTYTLSGEALEFKPLVTTRMHCAEAMEIEKGLLQALGATRSWRTINGRLELVDEKGLVVAQFEAVAPR